MLLQKEPVRRVGLVVNPIAGSGRGARLLYRLIRQLNRRNIEPVVNITTKPWQAYDLVRTASGISSIICLGGDGTVNEVVNALTDNLAKEHNLSLGVLPVGTGNVIAKELKLPHHVEPFIKLLEKGETRRLDVGSALFPETGRVRRFISMAGIGFDAEVARTYHQFRMGIGGLSHLVGYMPLALKINLTYKLPRITIEVDGRIITREASFLQVANVQSYGGPFIFARRAQPNDGLLDIVWFKAQIPGDILRFYWYAHWYDVTTKKGVYYNRGRHIKISSGDHVPVQVDGDFSGYLPVEIHVIPGAIDVLAPPEKADGKTLTA